MRYIISDLHLDHGNMNRKDYSNRPFDTEDEMNHELISNWNNTVSETDTVFFLGDLAMASRSRQSELLDKLNGSIAFIIGNHDDIKPDDVSEPLMQHAFIQHGKYQFYLVHNPTDKPTYWNGWTIHGHVHNNNMTKYPFINQQQKTSNVSVELINYKPISLDKLVSMINTKKNYTTIDG